MGARKLAHTKMLGLLAVLGLAVIGCGDDEANIGTPASRWVSAVDGDRSFRCLIVDSGDGSSRSMWCYEVKR